MANKNYTCIQYREEMRLLGLKNSLNQKKLSDKEKKEITKQIKELESIMNMD